MSAWLVGALRLPAQALSLSAVACLLVMALDPFEQVFAARIALLVVVTIALNLLISGAGLLSMAGAAFLGMGAYGVIIVSEQKSLPLAAAVVVVVAVTWVTGWLLGVVSMRVSHFYLALTTLGFMTLFQVLLRRGGDTTGASYGLIPPLPEAFGRVLTTEDLAFVSVVLAAIGVVLARSFLDSRVGRAWRLMRESPVAAESFGVNLLLVKTSAFAYTAAVLALTGCLYAFVIGAVTPESFNLARTIDQLVYVVVGGVGSVAGSVLGPVVLEVLPEMFSSLAEYREFFFGAFVLVILVLSPTGLAGLLKRGWDAVPIPRLKRLLRTVTATSGGVGVTPDPAALRSVARPERAEGQPAVEYRDVTVKYGGNVAVDDLSFRVRAGSIHGIIGPNGAGKTTVVNALTGQVAVAGGEVLICGRRVRSKRGGVPTRRLARIGVARTFQTPKVVPDRTVLENVKLGLYAFGRSGLVASTVKPRRDRRAEAEAGRRAAEALARVGFDRDLDTEVSSLSFGDLRRLEIARAIVSEPSLLLLDEPTSGLETDVADEILTQLRDLQATATSEMTILMIEHNVPLILGHCDDVTAMADGTVIASEPASTIRDNPAVRRSYLGEQLEMEALATEEGGTHV